jgi:hypothetical protein
MLTLDARSVHGQEQKANDFAASQLTPSEPAESPKSLDMPDLDTPWLPPDSKSIPNGAEALARTSAAWEGVYFAHLKDIVDFTTQAPTATTLRSGAIHWSCGPAASLSSLHRSFIAITPVMGLKTPFVTSTMSGDLVRARSGPTAAANSQSQAPSLRGSRTPATQP